MPLIDQNAAVRATEALTDEEIISRVLSGEKQLYELIMRKYNQRLYKICRAYVRDEDMAEDVMQETYVNAYRKLDRFEGRSKFSTWLTRILINEALGQVKQQRRFAPLVLHFPGQPASTEEHHLSTEPTPEEHLMNNELKEILERAVDDLPEKYRVVYMMREVEEMSVTETGECLHITESNVKVRLNRAKEMLREHISKLYRGAELFEFNLVRCDRIVAGVMSRINS